MMFWGWVKVDDETFTTFAYSEQGAYQQLRDALARHAPDAHFDSLEVWVAEIEAGEVFCTQAPLVPLVR